MNEYDRLLRLSKRLSESYPKGTRVMCLSMGEDMHRIPDGTKGTVFHVDSMSQIHVNWDNGSGVPLNPDVDSFRTLTAAEIAEEQTQGQDIDPRNIVQFGDDSFIVIPSEPIECSKLGYFDDLEYDCWELVKKYCDKLGIQILPNEDGEQSISFDIAKGIQDHILSTLEDTGVNFKFTQPDEGEAPVMSM
jgi:hypothetical protein